MISVMVPSPHPFDDELLLGVSLLHIKQLTIFIPFFWVVAVA
jgi:hypothetical protein